MITDHLSHIQPEISICGVSVRDSDNKALLSVQAFLLRSMLHWKPLVDAVLGLTHDRLARRRGRDTLALHSLRSP